MDTEIFIRAESTGVIDNSDPCGWVDGEVIRWCKTLFFDGPGTQTLRVVPDWDGTLVTLSESGTDSSTETDNTCGGGRSGSVTVKPAQDASCKFTNSVFFEGIPTLSQYGLAIMALLMLGVGFVGFRRFV